MTPLSGATQTPKIRVPTLEDAESWCAYAEKNREFLRPYEPVRPPDYYTVANFHKRIKAMLNSSPQERAYAPWLMIIDDELVGLIGLSNISRGAFQSASLGYSVDEDWNDRGIATAAVELTLNEAFGSLGLHRVSAGTLVDNHASQRVLEKNHFIRIGCSPYHLQINGKWRDHIIFAITRENWRAQ